MKKEERQLLLKDLSARLPYNPMVHIHDLNTTEYDNYLYADDLDSMMSYSIRLKPYLRPMSSMTEEEQRTLDSMCNGVEMVSRLSGLKMFDKAFNWLNENHFDYRGLIEKGLAIDATGLDVY